MKRQNLNRRNSIINFLHKFCQQYLNDRYYRISMLIVHRIEKNPNLSLMNYEPEIWASSISQILVSNKVNQKRPQHFDISIDTINRFYGTSNAQTTRLKSEIINTLQAPSRKRSIRVRVQEKDALKITNYKDNYIDNSKKYVEKKKEPDFLKLQVLYGTNRNKVDKGANYENTRDDKLHLGYCEVSIPAKHKIGNLERPSWFRTLFFEESSKKHFTILSNNLINEMEFRHLLQNKVGESDEKDSLLFIHGFNVEFNEAIMRTAQLGHDLNFKGGISSFSWPSIGKVSGYTTDCDSAKLSSRFLCDFLKILVNDNTKKLHIIAHSMGNVVLTEALVQLKKEGFLPNTIINQIILAAPDIDKDIFINQIMPSINGIARLTMYASDRDKALLISRKIRHDYNRLGEGGENIVLVDGLESIDASKVDTALLGHGYFADTQSLINDIHMVFLGIPPDSRLLDSRNKTIDGIRKLYWTFRNS